QIDADLAHPGKPSPAIPRRRGTKRAQRGRKDALRSLRRGVTQHTHTGGEGMNIKLLGLVLIGALALAAPSFGGGAPIVARPLAVGTMKATTIQAKTGAMVLESIKVAPGGSFGWHEHGSPVAVVVTGG